MAEFRNPYSVPIVVLTWIHGILRIKEALIKSFSIKSLRVRGLVLFITKCTSNLTMKSFMEEPRSGDEAISEDCAGFKRIASSSLREAMQ